MEQIDQRNRQYAEILRRELIPAMGCTEPIAVAYCAARARALLGALPDRAEVIASGNIIKNVKSVIVPNTGGARGLESAAAIGIVAGREDLGLEVLSGVTEPQVAAFRDWLARSPVTVRKAEDGRLLSITVRVFSGSRSAAAQIADAHDRVVYLEQDGRVLLDKSEPAAAGQPDGSECLSVAGICEFAGQADLEALRPILDRQIAYNSAIADEGLRHSYGANIGKVLLQTYGNDVKNRAKARAAAGSDARMNGCELPVVINSGSGNQGMTVSLPVLEYARELQSSRDELYRALIVANLIAIHVKAGIGCLSAYCGAVSAGAGAGAGIAWLRGGRLREVAHTVVNTLAITSGIVCDGAKASCAAKIAIAVEAGILGYDMFRMGQEFFGGEGIVSAGVENTIRNIGRLGQDGMRETDREILGIMTSCVD